MVSSATGPMTMSKLCVGCKFFLLRLAITNKAHSSLGSLNILIERVSKAVSSNSNSVTIGSNYK